MPSVTMYVIKDEHGMFTSDRHGAMGTFEAAINNGTFFNTRKAAEKRIKDILHDDIRWTYYIHENGKTTSYHANETAQDVDSIFRPRTLSVVELEITLKE